LLAIIIIIIIESSNNILKISKNMNTYNKVKIFILLLVLLGTMMSCGKGEDKKALTEEIKLESRSKGEIMTVNEKRIMKWLSYNKTFNESFRKEYAYMQFISKEVNQKGKYEKLKKLEKDFESMKKNSKVKESDIEKLYEKDFGKNFYKGNKAATLGMLAYKKQLDREVKPFLEKYNISYEEYSMVLPKAKTRLILLYNKQK